MVWFEVLIFPAFCFVFLYILLKQLNLWDKVLPFFGKIKEHNSGFRWKTIDFSGIGKFFRK